MLKVCRFCLVGALVFGVDFAALWLLKRYVPELAAVSGAYFLAVAVHFILNKSWVFGSEKKSCAGELARYVVTVAICWLCTVSIVWIALRLLTPNVFLAKALAIPPTTALSFVLMRFFVFR